MTYELLFTILALPLCGLSVLAFKQPKVFFKLYPILILLGIITIIASTAWSIGVSASYSILKEFIPNEKLNNSLEKIESYKAYDIYITISSFFFLIFCTFLHWLSEQVDNVSKEKS
jgi:hypothetical protein